jgi:hypothetical protein
MADFLDEKRREIQERLKELRPLVEEYHKLEAAEQALAGAMSNGGTTGSASGATTTKRRRNAATASPRRAAASAGAGRRGRPKGSGTRAREALELVGKRPGITIPELADAMGIKQNYLYRVMPTLAEEGKVKKEGRGWHAAS